MRLSLTSDVWWKNAVIYCLDIETYADGDGDGIGDFRGAMQRIDHLDRMGVTCIWLMPFFPTPDRDDGYDITDFYSVDPRLGTLGDFAEFMRVARDRGIRVIADLVVNHTSDEHPWFREARSSRESRYRDWYIWSDRPEPDDPGGIVFPDQETSLWEYDETTDQYYFHRFYRFQPDLNTANPEVQDEIARILGFWMELGLSGFRVDAVPYLLEQVVEHDEDKLPDPHEFFNCLRAFLNRRDGSAALLGEVNLPYDDLVKYFGNDLGNEITMCFDFIGMQRMYLSLARKDARPLIDAAGAPPAAEGLPVGDVRTQPRRAHAGQAQLFRTRGGLRRFRPGGAHAVVRPGPAPSPAHDARRRHGPDQDGVQPAVLTARHTGPLLR